MNMNVGFPTLGELIQFTYDTAGVLPRKRGLEDELDEKEKKSLQKALSRLAKEEGNINENFGDLIKKLAFIVAGYVSDPRANFAIGESLRDLLDVYQAILKDDGTYLDKAGTIKWLINEFIIGRLALSIKKNTLRFNIAARNFSTPGEFWFLPTIENEKVTYPLEKAMVWIYEECDRTQKQFHCPDDFNSTKYVQQEQNLENAQNWIKNNGLPSLPALIWNFNYSIDRINDTSNSNTNPCIDNHLRENICLILFIARASTFVFRELLSNFDLSFVGEICEKFKIQSNDISDDFLEFETSIKNELTGRPYLQSYLDEIWLNETSHFLASYANIQTHLTKSLEAISYEDQCKIFQNPIEVQNLIQRFGKFSIKSIAAQLNSPSSNEIPENFPKLLLNGLDLKNNNNTSQDDIALYEVNLKQSNLELILPWMLPWIKGAYHYRREEYQLAFPFFKEAFNSAKYCAGKNQYKLVNQFVEVAAKNNKRLEFNKGIRWAQYLGIEIRWLRKDEPTDEKLDFVFAIMQKANYHSL